MSENDAYTNLAKRLGAPLSTRFFTLLEAMMSPKEAEICLELIQRMT